MIFYRRRKRGRGHDPIISILDAGGTRPLEHCKYPRKII